MIGRWLAAARPATLLIGVTPVIVGTGLAEHDGSARWEIFLAALVGALLIQVGVNLANDVADAQRGADSEERVGPPRAVATGQLTARQVWTGAWVAFGGATVAGIYLTIEAGWIIVVIGTASILAALGYTSGPAYGYRALGEVAVFVFFGPVATAGSRFVHDRTVPADAWILAIPVGLLITAVLVANNLRDIATDRASNKRTLAVVLGPASARMMFAGLVWAAFALTVVAVVAGWVPRWTGLAILAAPAAVPLIRSVRQSDGAALIVPLKGTVQLQAAYGLLAAAGALVS